MKKRIILAGAAVICGYLIISGHGSKPALKQTRANVSERGPSKVPPAIQTEQQPMSDERKASMLLKFSPDVRQLDRQLSRDYEAYQADYERYLEIRDEFVRAMTQAKGNNNSELENKSAALDTALLALKARSQEISLRSGQFNQAVLAEYQSNQKR